MSPAATLLFFLAVSRGAANPEGSRHRVVPLGGGDLLQLGPTMLETPGRARWRDVYRVSASVPWPFSILLKVNKIAFQREPGFPRFLRILKRVDYKSIFWARFLRSEADSVLLHIISVFNPDLKML